MKVISLLFILSMPFASTLSQTDSPKDRRLKELAKLSWENYLAEHPMEAGTYGDYRYLGSVPSLSESSLNFRKSVWLKAQSVMEELTERGLPEDDPITFACLKYFIDTQVGRHQRRAHLVPLLADGGFHTSFLFMVRSHPFEKEAHYRAYIERLQKFREYVGQNIHWMREGLKEEITMPGVVLEGYESSIDPHVVDDPADSYYFSPFRERPAAIGQRIWDGLKAWALEAIRTSVVPGYREFGEFLREEYRPGARESIGLSDIPGGRAQYEQLVRHFTTLDISPEEVYQTGLAEVASIRSDMEAVIRETGFEGSFSEFLEFLRTDPQFYCDTPDCLLREAAWIAKRVDGLLPQYFGHLPRLPYGVEPVPAEIAPKYTTGRYIGGSLENHKAGFYWVNTYQLDNRPLYSLPALTLHEAVPGHHLQISLAQELEGLPDFRANSYISAFGEGWALYCEWLGKEMGIYRTPYEEFGRLSYEMWRALRLVVDVGIHANGWTREEAIRYMADNSALSLHNITTEVDRYISWPGQALSYKMGELKIRELRKMAEEKLGDRMDLRTFHDIVLQNGSVPLPVLEVLVREWVDRNGELRMEN